MKLEKTTVANWGNYPKVLAEIAVPDNRQEALRQAQAWEQFITRGNGKCYGDAALGDRILSTRQLNRILHFDEATGIIHCEAGALLGEILQKIVPAGWFFHVTPGIKNITVGGAIASDVHGKNHPSKGCFSNWLLSFELLRSDGEVVVCSREENAELFWQSCGGMGWTGVILTARFQLMRISSVQMRQMAIRADNLEALFEAFEQHQAWPYAAGWVDCLSTGAAMGRGVVYFARHEETANQPARLEYLEKKPRNIPFYAPSWLLNRWSIGAHNAMLFSKAKTSEQLVNMDRYFYPLDAILNWNRLYGRRGFIQYQFCLPLQNSFEGIRQLLKLVLKSRDLPFLTVLKRHGQRPAAAVHSFPIEGYSLALDFPRTRTVFDLVKRMDELVWKYDGKIYLAKDACSSSRMGRVDPALFGEQKFHSLLKARLLAE